MIRVEKTTPNGDAARTLIAGVLAAICILIGLDPAIVIYERYVAKRPWIAPIIQIVPGRDDKPTILYKAVARFPVSGTWTAFLELNGTKRICTHSGRGNYRPNDRDPQAWDWATWLGDDCAVPAQPFEACVYYNVRSERGVWDLSDPVCSRMFDPVAGREIEE